jgi:hypothetical protein
MTALTVAAAIAVTMSERLNAFLMGVSSAT